MGTTANLSQPIQVGDYKPSRAELEQQLILSNLYPESNKQFDDEDFDAQRKLQDGLASLRNGNMANLRSLLPLMFSLKGEPYHLQDHFPFEPFFESSMPKKILLKTGRQVSKSTSLAAQGVMISSIIPFFNTLFVTPLYEMIRRFSTNYVRGFIDQSPVRTMLVDSTCNNSVLQRTFINNSSMFFSFAYLDADRTRGLNCDKVSYDEVQDMDPEFIPIIRETMSGSRKWGIEQYAGTPKTLDGTIEQLWIQSSQAEWHMQCKACNYENIPSLAHDLDKMIGPKIVKDKISEGRPGVVCAKCGKPVFPREGGWVHHVPQERLRFAAYHVPQIIMPMHYADPIKWGELLGKREGFGNTPTNVFYNEVCGESYDTGAKLVTMTHLIEASTSRPNNIDYIKSHVGDYTHRVCAVDWGGGGDKEISFTVLAVLGLLPNGNVDVLFGHRFRITHDYYSEARAIIDVINQARCTHLVHDFAGAGAMRETIIAGAGIPLNRIIPIVYQRASVGSIMKYKDENMNTGQRAHYQVDKPRSLVMTCEMIKTKMLRFFKYDFRGAGQEGLLHDFLALVEEKVDSRLGKDVYTVIRGKTAGPDDFAHAVNMGNCALHYMTGNWPDIAAAHKFKLDIDTIRQLHPVSPDWDLL